MSKPTRQRCGQHVSDTRFSPPNVRLCRHWASYLVVGNMTDCFRVEVMCSQHIRPMLQQPALPGWVEQIATWDPKRAENGWLWS